MAIRPAGNFTFTVVGNGEFVDAKAFAESFCDALDALQAVDETVSSVDGGSLAWQIVEASTNSPMMVKMQSVPKILNDFSEPVLNTFMDGIEELDSRGTLPRGFSPPAIKAMKRFADIYGAGISQATFSTPIRRFTPTHRLVANVTRLAQDPRIVEADAARPDYFEIGELDGTVESLIAQGQLYFSLYDALSGVRVKCTFDADLSEQVRASWQKRVYVRGRIRFAAGGQPKEMRVDSLGLKPSLAELPQFKGVYINITGGVESSEYIRGLRDDD